MPVLQAMALPRDRRIRDECLIKNKYQTVPIAFHINTATFASQLSNGVVVQLVRMSACHAEGRGFESRPFRHIIC